jgi:hypothetical protein
VDCRLSPKAETRKRPRRRMAAKTRRRRRRRRSQESFAVQWSKLLAGCEDFRRVRSREVPPCGRVRGACSRFRWPATFDSGGKLDALQTPRAVRLRHRSPGPSAPFRGCPCLRSCRLASDSGFGFRI